MTRIEITCLERFARTLKILDVDEGTPRRSPKICAASTWDACARSPRRRRARIDAMKRIAEHHRLGLISNFDDSETGHLIMRDTGIRELFDAVIISADTGYRKPNPLIFKRILDAMNLEPADILFVGDTPLDDVLGSKGVGMHSAWIRTRGRELPEGIPAPDIIISDLAELPAALGLKNVLRWQVQRVKK